MQNIFQFNFSLSWVALCFLNICSKVLIPQNHIKMQSDASLSFTAYKRADIGGAYSLDTKKDIEN